MKGENPVLWLGGGKIPAGEGSKRIPKALENKRGYFTLITSTAGLNANAPKYSHVK